MSLTPHQREKLGEILHNLNESGIVLINGSAGVGKTFLATTLIANHLHGSIEITAPTNNAVDILKDSLKKIDNINFSFKTTHSSMKLKKSITKQGKVEFKPNFKPNYPPLKNVKFLVVDEVSMLNTPLLEYIETYAKMHKTKVILIGDSKQLPPVGEEVSPVFTRNYPTVTLTEIIRQKEGSPIIELSNSLTNIFTGVPNLNSNKEGYIFSNDLDKVIKTLAQVNGTNELKYISYTNHSVDKINNAVRKEIYGRPGKFELGEYLIFNAPYGEEFFTNTKVKVEKIEILEENFVYTEFIDPITRMPEHKTVRFKFYSINSVEVEVANFDNPGSWSSEGFSKKKVHKIKVIHEDSEGDHKKICNTLKKNAIEGINTWPEYYQFSEIFADLNYCHAMTVHKTQGCTFNQVILDVKESNHHLLSQPTKEKLFYTAVTRASTLLVLYNT